MSSNQYVGEKCVNKIYRRRFECILLDLYTLLVLLCGAALLVGRSRDRFPVVSLGIFSVVPPAEPCALRSTQPLKFSTRDISWGKGGRCVWLTTYHPCSSETSRKSGVVTTRYPLGQIGLSRETFTFTFNKD